MVCNVLRTEVLRCEVVVNVSTKTSRVVSVAVSTRISWDLQSSINRACNRTKIHSHAGMLLVELNTCFGDARSLCKGSCLNTSTSLSRWHHDTCHAERVPFMRDCLAVTTHAVSISIEDRRNSRVRILGPVPVLLLVRRHPNGRKRLSLTGW